MVLYQPNIVIGCMVYLVMKHLAHGIGRVGMELQQNNYALVVYFTMKMHTVATGQKMSMDARNIVIAHSFIYSK